MSQEALPLSAGAGQAGVGGGLVARWERLPRGWLFFVACDCGSMAEPVFEDDLEALGGFSGVQAVVFRRFRRQHPRCRHLKQAARQLQAAAVGDASEYLRRLEEELNVRWGM